MFKDTDKIIDLHGNPFHCDCNMNPFLDWMRQMERRSYLANKMEIRCYDGYPVTNAGKRIVNVEMLDCAPSSGRDRNGIFGEESDTKMKGDMKPSF